MSTEQTPPDDRPALPQTVANALVREVADDLVERMDALGPGCWVMPQYRWGKRYLITVVVEDREEVAQRGKRADEEEAKKPKRGTSLTHRFTLRSPVIQDVLVVMQGCEKRWTGKQVRSELNKMAQQQRGHTYSVSLVQKALAWLTSEAGGCRLHNTKEGLQGYCLTERAFPLLAKVIQQDDQVQNRKDSEDTTAL